MKKVTKDANYHHGDLRGAIILAATEHVEQTQSWGFSLRAIAKIVGVSHNAPYAHFRDKTELLGAIAAKGFDLMTSSLKSARYSAVGSDNQAIAVGLAYIEFGRMHPGLYRLMFDPLFANDPQPIVVQTGKQAFEEILTALNVLADEGFFPKSETPTKAFSAWAMVHGMTLLILDRRNIGGSFDDQQPLPASIKDGVVSLIYGFKQPRP